MNYGFFEELAEILSEQSAAKGREKVSEEFIDHIVKPASVEFADDQDLQNAVEQEAIDPISFYSLIANTEDTSSGSAEDKSQFMLERAREFFNVKSDVPEDLDEIPSIDADLTDVDNNQIWDVFNALNNLSHSRPAAGQKNGETSALEALLPVLGTLLGGGNSSSGAGGAQTQTRQRTSGQRTASGGNGLDLNAILQFAFQLWPELRNINLGALGGILGSILGGTDNQNHGARNQQNDPFARQGNAGGAVNQKPQDPLGDLMSAGLDFLGKMMKK